MWSDKQACSNEIRVGRIFSSCSCLPSKYPCPLYFITSPLCLKDTIMAIPNTNPPLLAKDSLWARREWLTKLQKGQEVNCIMKNLSLKKTLTSQGTNSDKGNFPPVYVPLLTYTNHHEINEWICQLARYHNQITEVLHKDINLMFTLKTIASPPLRDTGLNNTHTTPPACSTSAQSSPSEDQKQHKGKGWAPHQSPTLPSLIDNKLLSPLWEPRTIESPPTGTLFRKIGGLACESSFCTEARPSHITLCKKVTVNAHSASVVKKMATIMDLYNRMM